MSDLVCISFFDGQVLQYIFDFWYVPYSKESGQIFFVCQRFNGSSNLIDYYYGNVFVLLKTNTIKWGVMPRSLLIRFGDF